MVLDKLLKSDGNFSMNPSLWDIRDPSVGTEAQITYNKRLVSLWWWYKYLQKDPALASHTDVLWALTHVPSQKIVCMRSYQCVIFLWFFIVIHSWSVCAQNGSPCGTCLCREWEWHCSPCNLYWSFHYVRTGPTNLVYRHGHSGNVIIILSLSLREPEPLWEVTSV